MKVHTRSTTSVISVKLDIIKKLASAYLRRSFAMDSSLGDVAAIREYSLSREHPCLIRGLKGFCLER